MEYTIHSNYDSSLKTFFNASRSYRVPTFNDRFWGTQGNPNLDPEEGMSLETGFEHKLDKEKLTSTLRVNAFYMNINNWIEWLPGGSDGWVPTSLDKVISKGIEIHYNANFNIGNVNSDVTANYTLNPSIKTGNDNPDQQRVYTPKNMANMSYMLNYKRFTFNVDGSYTGERFYDYAGDESKLAEREALKSYTLVNCGLAYKLKVKDHQFDCSFSANNIFDTDYQNQHYYAMPGINFRLSISAKINVINNNN